MAPILILGATGQVGQFLLPRILDAGAPVIAVSRNVPDFSRPGLTWLQQDLARETAQVQAQVMLSAGPLGIALRQARRMPGLRRMVALSSASVLFKQRSPDLEERRRIETLVEAERSLTELAEKRDVDLTLLRPTLIYGGAGPSAVESVKNWLGRLRWAPVAGDGLRQPVHADDLAGLMLRLVVRDGTGPESFELGGGETLTYREFLRRAGSATGANPALIRVPAWAVSAVLRVAHAFGRFRAITPAMVARQRMDLVVDDSPAREQLGWNPRPFRP